jgi:type II secretory ATPase GspE/PulE/Tfp pilus assembly ATPase PilB-like protein
MARLDIAEKRLPQDGRISLRIAGSPVDVRVSTIPAGYGERVVLRLLDKRAASSISPSSAWRRSHAAPGRDDRTAARHLARHRSDRLGQDDDTVRVAAALERPQRNIMTVEDPIEYYIDGVGQTQVNTKVEMTFARGLRAILRQDPDVVMVGEIRDLETAQIAVQASLTGHLVLSTLHTIPRSARSTRLRDMGVEPFLLSSSLIGLLAQAPGARARSSHTRRLCRDCARTCRVRPAGRHARDAVPAVRVGRRTSRRLPRTHRHLRVRAGRRGAASPDPRERRGNRPRAPRAHAHAEHPR